MFKEIAGDSVEGFHHHRSCRGESCGQLLSLAEFVVAALPRPVAAVHHHTLLWQVLQGEGVGDMVRHGEDDKCLVESFF